MIYHPCQSQENPFLIFLRKNRQSQSYKIITVKLPKTKKKRVKSRYQKILFTLTASSDPLTNNPKRKWLQTPNIISFVGNKGLLLLLKGLVLQTGWCKNNKMKGCFCGCSMIFACEFLFFLLFVFANKVKKKPLSNLAKDLQNFLDFYVK